PAQRTQCCQGLPPSTPRSLSSLPRKWARHLSPRLARSSPTAVESSSTSSYETANAASRFSAAPVARSGERRSQRGRLTSEPPVGGRACLVVAGIELMVNVDYNLLRPLPALLEERSEKA